MRALEMFHHLILVFVVTGLAFATGSMAWAAGGVANGKAIAQQQCSNCHIIEKNATNAIESQPAGPDFMSIKGLNAATLKARLNSPHPVMSKFPSLSDQQIADLVAYIGSVNK